MTNKTDIPQFLLWIDLETTGLDVDNGRILEYACICTDLNLREIFRKDNLIRQNVESAKSLMHPDIVEMHTKNRLLDLLTIESRNCYYEDSIVTEEAAIAQLIDTKLPPNHQLIIAGSSIHFDKEWVKIDWPNIYSRLHYRNFDVSVFRLAFKTFLEGESPSKNHRAISDLEYSISIYRKMIELVNGSVKAQTST